MNGPFKEIIAVCWFVFIIYWGITAWMTGKSKRAEPLTSSLLNSALLWGGFVLILDRRFQVGLLALRFMPSIPAVEITGVALVAIGIGFAIWSRTILGTNWSDRVRITEGQQLIRSGPYAFVRNPIYSGISLAILGMALTTGNIAGLLGLALVVVSLWRKGHTEERFLLDEFGDAYAAYQKEVKFLIPFII